jgi:hypothetical protein
VEPNKITIPNGVIRICDVFMRAFFTKVAKTYHKSLSSRNLPKSEFSHRILKTLTATDSKLLPWSFLSDLESLENGMQ